jgi:hypothetical protein
VLARGEHQVGPSAHDRERAAAELARRELGRAGQLVGHRGERHRELVAVGVRPPGVVLGDD